MKGTAQVFKGFNCPWCPHPDAGLVVFPSGLGRVLFGYCLVAPDEIRRKPEEDPEKSRTRPGADPNKTPACQQPKPGNFRLTRSPHHYYSFGDFLECELRFFLQLLPDRTPEAMSAPDFHFPKQQRFIQINRLSNF